MRVVIHEEILLNLSEEESEFMKICSVTLEGNHLIPQKIDLDEKDMYKILDIIDDDVNGNVSLHMYDTGRFDLEIIDIY
jgi:hypothetical protein